MIRIGVANIDVSHPRSFATILHQEDRARYVAVYNDGFRTDEEVAAFMSEFGIEKRYDNVADMAHDVDIVFVQGCNWDTHLRLAEPVIEVGKPVFIDKPIVGSLADCERLEALVANGATILGSSSVRYAEEIVSAKQTFAETEGEDILAVYGTAGNDEFNYAVHIVEGIHSLLGPGAESVKLVRAVATAEQTLEQYSVRWSGNRTAVYQTQTGTGQPFEVVITTTKAIHHFRVANGKIYKAMLDRICDSLENGTPLVPITDLTEPTRIMLAGKASKEAGGADVALADLKHDGPGFDGHEFEAEYAAKAKQR